MENENKVNMKDGTGRRERAEFRWRGEERGGVGGMRQRGWTQREIKEVE